MRKKSIRLGLIAWNIFLARLNLAEVGRKLLSVFCRALLHIYICFPPQFGLILIANFTKMPPFVGCETLFENLRDCRYRTKTS